MRMQNETKSFGVSVNQIVFSIHGACLFRERVSSDSVFSSNIYSESNEETQFKFLISTASAQNISCVISQVNGSMLAQNIGNHISIIGTVIQTKPNGASFDIQTGDSMVVSVVMQKPLNESVSGLVEVQGVGHGRTTVLCENYMAFPPDLAQSYDAVLDNEAVILCNSVPNPWKQ